MSLNPAEVAQTRQELAANRALCPLDDAALCSALGWTPSHLQAVLGIQSSNPADVWRLRDFLEQATCDLGGTPAPYTVLTPGKRQQAQGWFGGWTVSVTPMPATPRQGE